MPEQRPSAAELAGELQAIQAVLGLAVTTPLVDDAVQFEQLSHPKPSSWTTRTDRWMAVVALLMILTLAVGVYTAVNLPG